MHDGVELSFEDIQKEPDPYQLFLNSIRSHDTKRKYKNELGRFLKLVPAKFYEEALGEIMEDSDTSEMTDTSETTLSPLKQFRSGTEAEDISCKEGLQLVIKANDGSPACVTQKTMLKLIERGWAKSI